MHISDLVKETISVWSRRLSELHTQKTLTHAIRQGAVSRYTQRAFSYVSIWIIKSYRTNVPLQKPSSASWDSWWLLQLWCPGLQLLQAYKTICHPDMPIKHLSWVGKVSTVDLLEDAQKVFHWKPSTLSLVFCKVEASHLMYCLAESFARASSSYFCSILFIIPEVEIPGLLLTQSLFNGNCSTGSKMQTCSFSPPCNQMVGNSFSFRTYRNTDIL